MSARVRIPGSAHELLPVAAQLPAPLLITVSGLTATTGRRDRKATARNCSRSARSVADASS